MTAGAGSSAALLRRLSETLETVSEAAGELVVELAAHLGEPPIGSWVRDADGRLWLRATAMDWLSNGEPYAPTEWENVLADGPLELLTSTEARNLLDPS